MESNVFTKVADLAIPFGLLFAMNAFKKHDTNKKQKQQVKAKPPPKKTTIKKGGSCSLCSQQRGGTQAMVQQEIKNIAYDIKSLLSI